MNSLLIKYDNLIVIAQPSNQFNQEPLSGRRLLKHINRKFRPHRRMYFLEKAEINGPNTPPLFEFLKTEAKLHPRDYTNRISWNYEKFLVGKDGVVIKRFSPNTTPNQMEGYIVQALTRRMATTTAAPVATQAVTSTNRPPTITERITVRPVRIRIASKQLNKGRRPASNRIKHRARNYNQPPEDDVTSESTTHKVTITKYQCTKNTCVQTKTVTHNGATVEKLVWDCSLCCTGRNCKPCQCVKRV